MSVIATIVEDPDSIPMSVRLPTREEKNLQKEQVEEKNHLRGEVEERRITTKREKE